LCVFLVCSSEVARFAFNADMSMMNEEPSFRHHESEGYCSRWLMTVWCVNEARRSVRTNVWFGGGDSTSAQPQDVRSIHTTIPLLRGCSSSPTLSGTQRVPAASLIPPRSFAPFHLSYLREYLRTTSRAGTAKTATNLTEHTFPGYGGPQSPSGRAAQGRV